MGKMIVSEVLLAHSRAVTRSVKRIPQTMRDVEERLFFIRLATFHFLGRRTAFERIPSKYDVAALCILLQ